MQSHIILELNKFAIDDNLNSKVLYYEHRATCLKGYCNEQRFKSSWAQMPIYTDANIQTGVHFCLKLICLKSWKEWNYRETIPSFILLCGLEITAVAKDSFLFRFLSTICLIDILIVVFKAHFLSTNLLFFTYKKV